MTATAVAHTPTRIPFLARYKEGHELEGGHIERGRLCESCRARYFPQQAINRDYLIALKPESRDYFLQSCEVEKRGQRSIVWFPKHCHHCVRKTL